MPCTVDSCERKHKARGLCNDHYNAEYRRDNPTYDRNYRERNPKRIREREAKRRDFLNELKKEVGCADCHTHDLDANLHFDHRDNEVRLFIPAGNWNRSFNSIIAELVKCNVRCQKCHHKRHAAETLTRDERGVWRNKATA